MSCREPTQRISKSRSRLLRGTGIPDIEPFSCCTWAQVQGFLACRDSRASRLLYPRSNISETHPHMFHMSAYRWPATLVNFALLSFLFFELEHTTICYIAILMTTWWFNMTQVFLRFTFSKKFARRVLIWQISEKKAEWTVEFYFREKFCKFCKIQHAQPVSCSRGRQIVGTSSIYSIYSFHTIHLIIHS